MTEKLIALLQRARGVKVTTEQREQQRRSFAYGNTKIENERITREMVNEQADTLKRRANG
jgi:predicted RNA-binding protein with PIN domain